MAAAPATKSCATSSRTQKDLPGLTHREPVFGLSITPDNVEKAFTLATSADELGLDMIGEIDEKGELNRSSGEKTPFVGSSSHWVDWIVSSYRDLRNLWIRILPFRTSQPTLDSQPLSHRFQLAKPALYGFRRRCLTCLVCPCRIPAVRPCT
jgi:hypothetical protein